MQNHVLSLPQEYIEARNEIPDYSTRLGSELDLTGSSFVVFHNYTSFAKEYSRITTICVMGPYPDPFLCVCNIRRKCNCRRSG